MVKLLSIIYILNSTTSNIFIASLIFIKRNISNGSLCFHYFFKIHICKLLHLTQAHLILYRALRKSQINPVKKSLQSYNLKKCIQ